MFTGAIHLCTNNIEKGIQDIQDKQKDLMFLKEAE